MGKYKLKRVKEHVSQDGPKKLLINPMGDPLVEDSTTVIHSMLLPGFRQTIAIERGVEKNILFSTNGGIGDIICAEPVLRFALKNFHDCDISLLTQGPELFRHLKFKDVFDTDDGYPDSAKYYTLHTLFGQNESQNPFMLEYMSPTLTHCVDYPALCSTRTMLPVNDRVVVLEPSAEDAAASYNVGGSNWVAIHAGKHWQSRTFPKPWWDKIISKLLEQNVCPVLVGADVNEIRGTVDVAVPEGVIDMRNKLTVMQTVALLQRAPVVLTNDSSPLHMAVTGQAWIGFLATSKHPDFITHWRYDLNKKVKWGWRMQNLSLGGIWDIYDHAPNKKVEIRVDDVGDKLSEWLPDPEVVANWAIEKL